jgi:ribose transport system permease protein/putative xylitol transport system permease protein
VVTLVVGIAIGVANGGLMLLLRIPSFLVTLGMLSLTLGLATTISHATPVLLVDFAFPDFVNGSAIRGIPNVVVLTLLVLAAIVVVTSCTRYGRALYAIGGGEEISAFSGVRVRTYKMVTFALAGLLCALAGLIFAGQAGTSLSGIGGGIGGGRVLLDCIAAVVMGGTALSGGIGGPQRTAIGVLLIAVLSNGMDLLGLSEAMQEVVEGVAIIAAVALTIDRKKYGIIK